LLAAVTAAIVSMLPVASASGEVLYGGNGSGGRPADLLVVDPATGSVTENVGPVGFSVTGLADDPTTGTLYGVTGGKAATTSPTPGTCSRSTSAREPGRWSAILLPGTPARSPTSRSEVTARSSAGARTRTTS
jgi:hypothetical protein